MNLKYMPLGFRGSSIFALLLTPFFFHRERSNHCIVNNVKLLAFFEKCFLFLMFRFISKMGIGIIACERAYENDTNILGSNATC